MSREDWSTLTADEIRARLAVARERAMANFERDWGTRDVNTVADALRSTIADSRDPADWARRARARVGH